MKADYWKAVAVKPLKSSNNTSYNSGKVLSELLFDAKASNIASKVDQQQEIY